MTVPSALDALSAGGSHATRAVRSPAVTGVDELEAPTKGERTRRRLLDAAVEAFGTRGYRAASVTAIARTAGVTQAAAYAYFENKEHLFRSAIEADTAGLIDDALGGVGDVPVRQLGPTLLLLALDALDRHPLTRRVLAGAEAEADAMRHVREMSALGLITGYVADRIAEGQRTGDVRADVDAAVMADGIEALLIALLTSAVHSSETALDRYLVGVVEAFDAMLRPAT